MKNVKEKHALVLAINSSMEHNATIVYRSIFLGETQSLISSQDGWSASCHDTVMDNLSLTSFLRLFTSKPELAIFWTDVHQSQFAKSLAARLKLVSPDTKIFVFGRATTFIPQYFERPPFDYVHVSGDREASILDLMSFIDGNKKEKDISGVSIKNELSYTRNDGKFLSSEKWPYPNLSILPIDNYKDYTSSVHGARYSHRISVTAAKGCTWGCAYCGATQEEGAEDRRRDINSLFNWIEQENIDQYECYLHLYAPDLFYDQNWISKFINKYNTTGSKFAWRSVTTTKTLQDLDLMIACGKNGCKELAVGVEHINHKKLRPLKSTLDEIRVAAENCRTAGINLKGLVMLGYPSQTEKDVEFIGNFLNDLGVTVRFTGYTPLQKLKFFSAAELDSMNLDHFDRRTYFDPADSSLSEGYFYSTITRDDGYIHA